MALCRQVSRKALRTLEVTGILLPLRRARARSAMYSTDKEEGAEEEGADASEGRAVAVKLRASSSSSMAPPKLALALALAPLPPTPAHPSLFFADGVQPTYKLSSSESCSELLKGVDSVEQLARDMVG